MTRLNVGVRQNWDVLADFSKARLNDLRYLPRADWPITRTQRIVTTLSTIRTMEYCHGYRRHP